MCELTSYLLFAAFSIPRGTRSCLPGHSQATAWASSPRSLSWRSKVLLLKWWCYNWSVGSMTVAGAMHNVILGHTCSPEHMESVNLPAIWDISSIHFVICCQCEVYRRSWAAPADRWTWWIWSFWIAQLPRRPSSAVRTVCASMHTGG